MVKNFFKRWKKGIETLPPEKQIHAQMVGHIGSVVGLTIAIVVMLIRGVWYFSVFLFFIIWLQVVSYIGAKQKYDLIMKMLKKGGK